MKISFSGRRVKKLCEDNKHAQQRLGSPCASKLHKKLKDLKIIDNLQALRDNQFSGWKVHPLTGNRKGQLSVKLTGQMRLIFKPNHNHNKIKLKDGGLDWEKITKIIIIKITNYHV